MRSPKPPKNESERLARLRSYQILDTMPEQSYDDIVALAASICKVPIALVSLVDKDRQWFKARHGLGASETPRDVSFCGHVVETAQMLNVEDSSLDERFADNPLATGAPHVRFYRGAPLQTDDGFTLGTLCVIDHEPRTLTEEQTTMLDALSRMVMSQLELREQVAVAEELRYRHGRFFSSSLDLLCTASPTGYFQDLNPAWSELLGFDDEELRSEPFVSFVHPEDREATQAEAERLATGLHETVAFENRYRCKSGDYVLLSWSATVDAESGLLLAAARDITKQRQVEGDLRKARELSHSKDELFRAAIEASPSGLLMVDSNGRIVSANPQIEKMFGYSAGELENAPIEMLLPESVRSAHPALLRAFFAQPSQRQMGAGRDLQAQRKDRTLFPVEIGLSPVETVQGWIALAVVVDISERKLVEEALLTSKVAAEEANQAKSEFLANMSHELRTPLNSVIGFSKLLLKNKQGHLNGKEINFVERINDNGKHLLGLINEVLDLSKIEAGEIQYLMAATDVGAVVQTTVDELAAQAEEKELMLHCAVPEGLELISSDTVRLKQVLINLIGNAIKFTSEGSVTVRVLRNQDSNLPDAIEVVDTGIGIPADRHAAVFEPFRQADTSTSRTYGGTGLGLAISRELCRGMGFDLTLESEANVGTTFRISMKGVNPAARVKEEEAGCHTSANPKNPLVLVIDDAEDSRTLATHAFEDLGWRVITCASGHEGLKRISECSPDLVTVDLLMPDMSGWEVIRRLRADPGLRSIPLIAISSAADVARLSISQDIAVLAKPIDAKELVDVMGGFASKAPMTVLIVDDDKDARDLLREQVGHLATRVLEAADGEEGLTLVQRERPDLVLLDLMMPHVDGFEFLARLNDIKGLEDTSVVVVSAKQPTQAERELLGRHTEAVHQKGPWVQDELLVTLSRLGFHAGAPQPL